MRIVANPLSSDRKSVCPQRDARNAFRSKKLKYKWDRRLESDRILLSLCPLLQKAAELAEEELEVLVLMLMLVDPDALETSRILWVVAEEVGIGLGNLGLVEFVS